VVDAGGSTDVEVDRYRTRSVAEHAARLLNAGAARINHHALIGCRVEVK
jgi:small ligand-binding sensory domain FIST